MRNRQTLERPPRPTTPSPDRPLATFVVPRTRPDAPLSTDSLRLVLQGERYSPLAELGRGGMGRVDLVLDRALGRTVAQKTAYKTASASLLLSEAQIGAQLEHPSIVPVHDVQVDEGGHPHYVMRVVRGATLRDALEGRRTGPGGPMSLSQMLGVLRQVCLAVDYAHSRGVVHRDLKPENIITGPFGEVYVLDWGVAWIMPTSDLHGAARLPVAPLAGTPGYMGPEQLSGAPIDARADVFALGVILREVLTGERPAQTPAPPAGSPAARRRDCHSPPPRSTASFEHACRPTPPAGPRAPASSPTPSRSSSTASAPARSASARPTPTPWKARPAGARPPSASSPRLASSPPGRRTSSPPSNPGTPWSPNRPPGSSSIRPSASAPRPRRPSPARRPPSRAPRGALRSHTASRRGLTALYFRQFEAAESEGDTRRMVQYLELSRAYDDGTLALELSDEGALDLRTDPPAPSSPSPASSNTASSSAPATHAPSPPATPRASLSPPDPTS